MMMLALLMRESRDPSHACPQRSGLWTNPGNFEKAIREDVERKRINRSLTNVDNRHVPRPVDSFRPACPVVEGIRAFLI
ncbi:hypothetical protein [Paracoccus luteus]|uniref:hypothetical protein n=1 Tax=Paracoccus luteus TaxID=2508543 RepID=UPI00106FE0F5|nr:hypothetical protein [Paracoccus luteus]